MGNEDLCTTQRYVRVTGRDLERAMARLRAWREARGSVTEEVKALMESAEPRPERIRRSRTESGLQKLPDYFCDFLATGSGTKLQWFPPGVPRATAAWRPDCARGLRRGAV